jgi:dephospho-CoA kinase
MLKIGLTGGIGSGKTTVAKIFETLGVPVYYADDVAKQLMQEDNVLKQSIINIFGKDSYTTDGKLNRLYLSSTVFSNPHQLERLNAIVHPATIQHAEQWMQQQQAPYVIKEAALIFESGSQSILDYVIGVYAPQALRIKRTIKRDNIDKDKVLQRMQNQIDENIKMRLCDRVIQNDDRHSLMQQVLIVHETLMPFLCMK